MAPEFSTHSTHVTLPSRSSSNLLSQHSSRRKGSIRKMSCKYTYLSLWEKPWTSRQILLFLASHKAIPVTSKELLISLFSTKCRKMGTSEGSCQHRNKHPSQVWSVQGKSTVQRALQLGVVVHACPPRTRKEASLRWRARPVLKGKGLRMELLSSKESSSSTTGLAAFFFFLVGGGAPAGLSSKTAKCPRLFWLPTLKTQINAPGILEIKKDPQDITQG